MADELEPIDGFIEKSREATIAFANAVGDALVVKVARTMTEAEKAKVLCDTRKEYLRTHSGPPAQVEADSWIAVYRKATSLGRS